MFAISDIVDDDDEEKVIHRHKNTPFAQLTIMLNNKAQSTIIHLFTLIYSTPVLLLITNWFFLFAAVSICLYILVFEFAKSGYSTAK